jgi:hypothetical protein
VSYRQVAASCPSCDAPLIEDEPGRLTCHRCDGVLIADSVLGELLREAAPDSEFPLGVVAFPRRYDAPRLRCPVCRNQMRPGVLFEVPVEQCHGDGLWIMRDGVTQILATVRARAEERRQKDSDG